ncbi:MAG: UDP-N-acetylmuramoyl-tripeptide--D-alanyl-D-alanine ligase [Betaproteobacteria bacterium]|nr:UDP-N-acetylmuramoyl-tripeptide--D-alanyl-D-alanine ligase [Betaproteobacteria bacterium]
MLRLELVSQAVAGRLSGIRPEEAAALTPTAISTDTRQIGAGALFVALSGEHFDAHEFVAAAFARGAVAAIVAESAIARVEKSLSGQFPNRALPLVAVDDTRVALGALAAFWRARFSLPLIALTGSNGKTTTKEMIAAILRAAYGEAAVLATGGNFNNEIGLPLTLLRLHAGHRAAVIEMGMSHPGEIARLTGIARPTVALVTNVQRAHLEGMGTLAAIAEEKGAIYDGLTEDGIAVINGDDPNAWLWRMQNAGRRVIRYATAFAADVAGRIKSHGLETRLSINAKEGESVVTLAVPGQHNARNALAAAAATLAAGVPFSAVMEGLNGYRGIKGRLQKRDGINGALLLDDSYNANPDSVRAGIDVLAAASGKRVLVFGDMGETGSDAERFHEEIGIYAKKSGVDLMLTLGEMSAVAARAFGEHARSYEHPEALTADLRPLLDRRTTVLVKGSRFMRMERIADAIAASISPTDTKGGSTCC